MPLPTSGAGMPWPPQNLKEVYRLYALHDAWYSGDPNRLAAVYAGAIYPSVSEGFFSGALSANKRQFWAQEAYEERKTMLHVPVAGDIAATNADLLFSEPPKIRIPEAFKEKADSGAKAQQERLDVIIDKAGLHSKFIEGAETCSAMGGIFLKPVWDKELSDVPLLSVDQADNAVPEFKFGILTAVTFWKVVEEDDDVIYRLLERHEAGSLEYGLYKGSRDELGIRIGLDAHPATVGLESFETQIPELLPEYTANIKPNRRFRGSPLGQSDFSGVEGLMDSLDEVFSSWMRDIRLGQGRLIVPEEYLEGSGSDRHFKVDKEVFVGMGMDPLSAKGAGITINQFAIRTEEHSKAALELLDRIVTAAGFSPQTFGIKIEGRAESGTALNIRERKTFITKSKKELYWKPALENIVRKLLLVDALHLGGKLPNFVPKVEFQDSLQNDVSSVAASVELLSRAQALSIETKVRMVHPDWEEAEIVAEVKRLKEETSISMPNPDDIGIT